MIYLTFDTNIWIYSLDDSWSVDNQFDFLEPWIKDGLVKLILPEIILKEWKNNEEKEVKIREKKLYDFFVLAEEILPSAFFTDYKSPLIQKQIIQDQIERINKFIDQVQFLPLNPFVEKKVIEKGIAKKAPMHKKTSIADAIIVYTLIDFAERNQGNHFFFISNNSDDFYEKGGSIHSDLKPYFDQLNIKAFKTLQQLTYELRNYYSLPVQADLDQKRKDRIKRKIKETVYNPEYEKIIADSTDSFILNLSTIEYILKESKPTKEQVIFVLALIDSDIAYEKKFYEKLSNASWFKILKNKGVFNPNSLPGLIQIKGRTQIQFWEPLSYLERLSNHIKNGKEIELIDEIITILVDIAKNSNEIYRFWYLHIKILVNIPNNSISKDVLNLIPIWLSGERESMLESMEICKNLLPKFLSEEASIEDIEKAEIILKHLYTIERIDIKDKEAFKEDRDRRYTSLVHLYCLKDSFKEKKLISKIANHCSDEIVIYLANMIKRIRFDFPNGLSTRIESEKKYFGLKIHIDNKDLDVKVIEYGDPDRNIGNKIIENFEKYNKKETVKKLYVILNELEIDYPETEENDFDAIANLLTNGSYYSFTNERISELNNWDVHGEKLEEIFALIFRDLLNEKVKRGDPSDFDLLRLFALDNFYRLAFFKKVALFVISENWVSSKGIFWDLFKKDETTELFDNTNLYDDLYELLNKVQSNLTTDEIGIIENTIEKGPQNDKYDYNNPELVDYWKFRWYSALRNIPPFNFKYEQQSQIQKRTYTSFENREVEFSSRSISPFSAEEILQKTNEEIVAFIKDFRTLDRWEGPTVSGFSSELEKAVEKDPKKFADEIEIYQGIYYIYAYHMFLGFADAGKKKKIFNWQKVIDFCTAYISNTNFYSGKLSLQEDDWRATYDWPVDAIANLLTRGMQDDNIDFDLQLLPRVKEILKILAYNLVKVEDFKKSNMDYATYSLNSTAGKVLRALLDYSLKRARNLATTDFEEKWEADIIQIYDDTFKKGIVDAYILTGWYFE